MPDPLNPDLERTAGAVADAADVDWKSETGEHPELEPELQSLAGIARLAAAHRDARRALKIEAGAVLGLGAEPEAAAAPPAAGFTWGFLRAIEPIGAGGYGEVWRAWDPTLEREVALKLRRLSTGTAGEPALARTSDPATRQWLEEARRLASVHHPNVVTVHGAAEHDGRAGLWTELLRGETLEHRLASAGPLAPREAARIGAELCEALAAVHAAGLVHGDVKASNVMLETARSGGTARERAVLMDFGTAHHAAGDDGWSLRSSAGTPLVMAPEVLAGGAATPSSDLYALGVLLHRLLTGRYPVDADSLEALRAAHARGRPPLATLRPGIPKRLAAVVERSLAPAPAGRPASAAEMGRTLAFVADPARGRGARRTAIGATLAALAAIALAVYGLQRPASVRDVPPERLPGPQVEAMKLGAIGEGTLRGERFGDAVAGLGDVNGDGLDDVLVSSTYYSGTMDSQGRVQLFLGNRAGKFGPAAWTAVGREPTEHFGAHLAPAGDVNGDGHADALVTSFTTRASDHQELRRISVFLGSPAGFPAAPATDLLEPQPESSFGIAMSGVGDLNGDGYGDVALGAFNHTRDHPYEGAVFVHYGGPHGLEPRPRWTLHGGARDAWLGNLMTRTGDVNGDGYDDLLLGAYGWREPRRGVVGRALLYLGGPGGLARTPAWTATGDRHGGYFGYSVGGVGDVNRDGFDDFVVMQPHYSGRAVNEGRALLYLGGPRGPGARPAWEAKGFSSNTYLSTANPRIGDVNGDGLPDLVFRSRDYSASTDRRQIGIVAVYLSPADPRRPHPAWYYAGQDPGTPIAHWDYPIGDFDGDGLGDFAVGQSGWYNGDNRGRVLLFLGQRLPLPGRPGPAARPAPER